MESFFFNVTGWYYPALSLLVAIVVWKRYGIAFWGKLLTAALASDALLSSAWRIVHLVFEFEQYDPWQPLAVGLFLVVNSLVLLAVASVPRLRERLASSVLSQVTPGATGVRRSIVATLLLQVITVNVYWVFWLHRTVGDLRRISPELLPMTPGQAVGRLFIPFYNAYWYVRIFTLLPRAVERLNAHVHRAPAASGYATPVITAFAIAGLLLNSLGTLNYGFFIAGELLLLTVVAYTQRYLNSAWEAPALRQVPLHEATV